VLKFKLLKIKRRLVTQFVATTSVDKIMSDKNRIGNTCDRSSKQSWDINWLKKRVQSERNELHWTELAL